jgi:glycopeptide antibiotics resistance protein
VIGPPDTLRFGRVQGWQTRVEDRRAACALDVGQSERALLVLLVIRYWVLPVTALTCGVSWAVIRLVMRVPLRRAALEALFAGYVAALLYVVFLLPGAARPDAALSAWTSVNLVPARTIVGIVRDHGGMVFWQIFGNVVLFMPLGFLLPVLNARFRRFALTAAVGLSASVGIELVQLAMLLMFIARRSVDVDDVILNVTGACLGWVMWRGAHALARPPAQGPGPKVAHNAR